MSLHKTILESLQKCEEKEQMNKLKTPKKTPQKQAKTKKKRKINWNAIEEMIKKYESLSETNKKEANKTWGRTIPYWKKALYYHKKGYSDSKTQKLAKESLNK